MLRKMFLLFLIFIMQLSYAGEGDGAEKKDVQITPSGFAYYQIGQIEQQTPADADNNKLFDQRFAGRLTLDAIIKKRLHVTVGAEAELKAGLSDNTKISEVNLKEAHGTYSFGDLEQPFLQIQTGYFPFKYNPEARNLGEYLYRTGTYPVFVITDFDNPKARLMGFNVSSTLFNSLRLNLLFTSEYNVHPYFDYSLSFLAAYKLPNKMLDFGAGIDFDRLIPIGKNENTEAVQMLTGEPVIEDGDTLKYSMRGTKLMGRFTFDPKPLLPFAEIFGSEDGKLYAEIALLGVKNYGGDMTVATIDGRDSVASYGFFPHRYERLPFMFGFNIPCFKMIDVLSFEAEYLRCGNYKLDIPASGNPTPKEYTSGERRTFWKWTFYIQKTITKGWAVKGLIGRDHFRALNAGSIWDPKERLNGPGDWHYNLRIMYSF